MRNKFSTAFSFQVRHWSGAEDNFCDYTLGELDQNDDLTHSNGMKTKRRLLTREELLDLEDRYFPGSLGNLLSLGAAHFRQTNRRNGRRQSRAGSGASLRRAAGH